MEWSTFQTSGGITGWQTGDGAEVALLVHGGPGLNDYTESFADEVAMALPGHRLARHQQRGVAPSTVDRPWTVAQAVDDLMAVVRALAVPKVTLIGHSWGGHLALHTAVAHPESVAGLVLIDALGAVGDGGLGTMDDIIYSRLTPGSKAQIEALDVAGLSPLDTGTRQIRLLWPGYFADPVHAPEPPPLVFDPGVNDAVMGDAIRLLGEGFLAAALPALEIPSVHVIGRASPIDPAAMRATASLLRGAVVLELDTGHFAWLEQPGSVTTAVRSLRA